jgi:hypothetical protein
VDCRDGRLMDELKFFSYVDSTGEIKFLSC